MAIFECTIEDITFRNESNGWTVMRVRIDKDKVSAVGIMPFAGVGERVRLTGEWVEHPDYGKQLKVSGCESIKPSTKSGIEKYLASGLIKGIGPATAKLIVQHFGVQTLDILESEPERLKEISGIGPKRAASIAESYQEQMEMRSTLMFLQNYDISPTLALKIYRRFGEHTQSVMKNNPYRLVDEVRGIGFKTADRLASAIGIAHDSPFRLESGIKYVLNESAASAGHVYLPMELLQDYACRLLDAEKELIDTTIRKLILERAIIAISTDQGTAVYLPAMYAAESDVARRMIELIAASDQEDYPKAQLRISRYETEEGVQLCKEQREAVMAAVNGGLTIITGGPGTGKTTSIRCMISLMSRIGEVVLTAPTGRAAKRMSEATGCPAKTIHRLLEFSGEDGYFQKDEDDPIDAEMVIVDEMSMVDIFLMQNLLKAIRPGTRLVMVGDADQLPSVGAGNVLKDLIDSGVLPVVRLTEIFRQAGESMIIQNAHRINHGQPPVVNTKGTDFFIERRDTVQAVCASMVQLAVKRLPEYMHINPLRDIQVLSPTKKGDVGVWNLNRILQEALNPRTANVKERMRGDTLFRLGDKVMQTRNNYQMEWRRGIEAGLGVFNGDMGFITDIDSEDHIVTVTFEDERIAEYDDTVLDDLELAYCISVHKSQGSEFPVVIIPVWHMPPMLMTRNLLYTAITRAKKMVVLVGREDCARRMVENNRIAMRFSALGRRLIEAKELVV